MLPTPPLIPKQKPSPPKGDNVLLPEPLLTADTGSQDEQPENSINGPFVRTGKPRRRHSEIERRRRAKMNEKFEELRELIPECRAFQFARRGGDTGIHKLDILTSAVRHIRALERSLSAIEPVTSVEHAGSIHTATSAGSEIRPATIDKAKLAEEIAELRRRSALDIQPQPIPILMPSALSRDQASLPTSINDKSRISFLMN